MVESRPTHDISRVFVGRQAEMAELTAALDDAQAGRGRMVMVAGEPGANVEHPNCFKVQQ